MKRILIIGLLVLLVGCNSNEWITMEDLPECESEIIEECYRTEMTSGFDLRRSIDIRTRCEGEYDYKLRKSSDWTNCNPIYEKIYT